MCSQFPQTPFLAPSMSFCPMPGESVKADAEWKSSVFAYIKEAIKNTLAGHLSRKQSAHGFTIWQSVKCLFDTSNMTNNKDIQHRCCKYSITEVISVFLFLGCENVFDVHTNMCEAI